jgi:hypothetical protein
MEVGVVGSIGTDIVVGLRKFKGIKTTRWDCVNIEEEEYRRGVVNKKKLGGVEGWRT